MKRIALAVALTGCAAESPQQAACPSPDLSLYQCDLPAHAPPPLPQWVTPAQLRAYDRDEHRARVADEAALRECAAALERLKEAERL